MLFPLHPPSGHRHFWFYHLYISVIIFFFFFCSNAILLSSVLCDIWNHQRQQRIFLLRAQQLHKKTQKEMVTMYIKLLAHAVSMSGENYPQNITLKVHFKGIIHSEVKTLSQCSHPNMYDWLSFIKQKRRYSEECNCCSFPYN